MKINGLVFVPDEDHDWIHVINEQSKEQLKYNENRYSNLTKKFGILQHLKVVDGFWKSEEIKIEYIEKSTLYDYLLEFIEKNDFENFIKKFMKYLPCISDDKTQLLLKNYANKFFELGETKQINPFK